MFLSNKGHGGPSSDGRESGVFSRTLRMVRQGSKPPFHLVAGNCRMAKCNKKIKLNKNKTKVVCRCEFMDEVHGNIKEVLRREN
jgi:hypothetical protein